MTDYLQDNRNQSGIGRKSLRGGAISIFARGCNVVIQVGTTLCLARLLSPHDYGLVAIVTALVGFGPMLIDLGTADATVQKARISQAEVSCLFWLNLLIGGGLAVVVACCSPLIARFYREPELLKIALFSALVFLFSALSIQHYSLLRRAMEFQKIAVIDTASNVVSSVAAITIALMGCGYWALVAKPVLQALLGGVGVWLNCSWRPGLPEVNSGVKELLRFGMHVTGFTMTDYAGRSADRIALGYLLGASSLGYYQNAFLLYDNLLSVLVSPLHSVAVASLTKLRDNVEDLRSSWAGALSALAFFAMPMFGVLAVASQDVITLLLGTKWEPAGPLLSVFAVRGIAHVVERTLGWLHVAAGRSDRWMKWGSMSALAQLVALFCGLPFGMMGVCVAGAVATFLLFLPALGYAGRPLGIGYAQVLRVTGRQLVAAILSVGLGFLVQHLWLLDSPRGVRLTVSISSVLGAYVLLAVGVLRVTKPIRLSLSLMQEFGQNLGSRLGYKSMRACE